MNFEEIGRLLARLLGLSFNLLLQVLLYKWITIKFILKGDRERFNKSKFVYYVLLTTIAVIVYQFVFLKDSSILFR